MVRSKGLAWNVDNLLRYETKKVTYNPINIWLSHYIRLYFSINTDLRLIIQQNIV